MAMHRIADSLGQGETPFDTWLFRIVIIAAALAYLSR
jgi:hypothetical protein